MHSPLKGAMCKGTMAVLPADMSNAGRSAECLQAAALPCWS